MAKKKPATDATGEVEVPQTYGDASKSAKVEAPAAAVEAEVEVQAEAEPKAKELVAVNKGQKRTMTTKLYEVHFFGGTATYADMRFEAVDPSEAISFFVIANGIRNAPKYRRRVTLING